MDISVDIPDAEILSLADLSSGGDLDNPYGVIKEALVRIALAADTVHKNGIMRQFGAVLEYELLQLAVVVFTRVQETMFTTLDGRGLLILGINPDFLVAGTPEERVERCMFGLAHELNHIGYPVLRMGEAGNVELLASWMADPLFKEQALEYWNNWTVSRHLGFSTMPTLDGQQFAMDGEKAYTAYAKWKRSESGSPVSKEQFLLTPEVCYGYLKEMPKPPKQRVKNFCGHGGAGSGGSSDPHGEPTDKGGTFGDGIDLDEAKNLVDGAIDSMMGRALRGNEAAKEALIEIGEQLGGEGSKFWSRYGIGELVGKSSPAVHIRFWEAFYERAVGSRVTDDPRMAFPRKMLGVQPFFEAVGGKLPIMPVGRGFEPLVHIYVDVSGSMPSALVDRIFQLTGNISGAEIRWHWFNTDVGEFTPGGPTQVGGGTDFGCVVDHVADAEEEPDAIVILTDGYAPHVMPSWADKAVWVITEGGDRWPEDMGMEVIETDIPAV